MAIANAIYTDDAEDRDRACPRGHGLVGGRIGDVVRVEIDWSPRYGRMRFIPPCICCLWFCPIRSPAPRSADTDGRADFNIPDAGLDKDAITRKAAPR